MCYYETHRIPTEKGYVNVYFEKQRRLYCLVHTTNNILQAHVYTFNDFKECEYKIDSLNILENEGNENHHQTNNNHSDSTNNEEKNNIESSNTNIFSYIKRGMYSFGNFNISVLYFLMNKHNMELQWVDNKEICQKLKDHKNSAILFNDEQLNDKTLIAFIINIVKLKFFDIYHHRHFYTIRKISDSWFKLDSSLNKPILLPTNKDVNNHLINIVKNNKIQKSDNYIIQVFQKVKDN
ncbi:hypothetical protein PFMG_02018 [Plasmodium falciparum IGH-CR14]|uniref:ubiquitinyl hydrolase 1 n=5 Tax=Plasmodium falciparum TaxID=5833 RepID=Q8IIP4_PLAF7|nr:Josephin domain-containing protein, putative [Plasmodium falciparum 3D7]ETW60947.1 hypothetical protein PFMC_03178 [Plasmodium falciparum CAMP/Malaysia]KAF4331123.1 hypothetical protein CYL21_0628 [Plasmodium falciparum NF54]KNG75814.1 hypothetical protein PFMG_02018 [Plasmodium falciparum IGH-CR14]SOS79154.1 conserved Plasmodium protein, unknown function [Plasmodium sp. gorilla clade G1]PKC49129.1 hypothetical protein CK202_1089 [Plasmodium falciparum NF54]|eukprot:XP_001347797.1 conserved Plasmodium protein, unknown function [Plasmodium falciparum 3D7]